MLLSRIAGVIFEDANGNGIQDDGELGIEGVRVVVTDSSAATQTVTTDENGEYMANVSVGLAITNVDESSLPPGAEQTAGADPTTLDVPSAGTATDSDGYQFRGKIEGVVFEDVNNNGVQDPGERGIAGVDVIITDSLGASQTVTADSDGEYSVSVPVGTAVTDIVESTLPPGAEQTSGANPTTLGVPAGGTATDSDGFLFPTEAPSSMPSLSPTNEPTGIPSGSPTILPSARPTGAPSIAPSDQPTQSPTMSPTETPGGKIIGVVFEDANGNGIQDDGELGIEGVRVVVTDSSAATQTVTTDENGEYMANVSVGLAITNVDESSLPPGAEQTAGADPTTLDVPSAGTATDSDGYQFRGKVEGVVFEDVNNNGVQDPGERGIAGVIVVITDSIGEISSLNTDETGIYMTEVPSGFTVIDVDESTLPPGGEQTAGTDPTTVRVPGGGTATDSDGYHFLTAMPTRPPTGSPSALPSLPPSSSPTLRPSVFPSPVPSTSPTFLPTAKSPSSSPSFDQSYSPSGFPSLVPSLKPSSLPSVDQSHAPSRAPSALPSVQPSWLPSSDPSSGPSSLPSATTSDQPSSMPSLDPSSGPSSLPSAMPSVQTSSLPSLDPSTSPSNRASLDPSSGAFEVTFSTSKC